MRIKRRTLKRVADFKGWFHKIDPDTKEEFFAPTPPPKTIYWVPGPGDRPPTPLEIQQALLEHPQAETHESGLMLYEFDVARTDEKPVEIPSGCYDYKEAYHAKPERLVPTTLRDDTIIKMPGITRKIIKDVRAFLANEKIYRDIGIQYRRGILLYGLPGNGKCLGKDTPILMFDGTIKMVQDIQVEDLIMGPDSKPRKIKSITSGREKMYRINPVKGTSWTCNESHILSVVSSGQAPCRGKNKRPRGRYRNGDVINISVKDYLKRSKGFQSHTFLYRTGIEFSEKPVSIDPYVLGYWLGDGTSEYSAITTMEPEVVSYFQSYVAKLGLYFNCIGKSGKSKTYMITSRQNKIKGKNVVCAALRKYNLLNNKHIPFVYKTNSREIRMQVLAGLIDSDGFTNNEGYIICLTNENLVDDVVYLARSLGFAAYKKKLNKKQQKETHKQAYYIGISGDTSQIPVLVERKKNQPRKQIKNVLHTGFELEDIGEGDYYGFELESSDGLFVLGDFTVTHNTTCLREIIKEEAPPNAVTIFLHSLPSSVMLKKLQDEKRMKVIIFEELVAIVRQHDAQIERILDFLDGESSLDNALIFATTNYPEMLPGNIVNRPSRFDRLIKVGNPDSDTCKDLLRLYLGREPTESEVKSVEDLSVAAVKEAAIISRLHDTSVEKAVENIKATQDLVKNDFAENSPIGLSPRSRFHMLADDFDF